jgi:hypothetical protein
LAGRLKGTSTQSLSAREQEAHFIAKATKKESFLIVGSYPIPAKRNIIPSRGTTIRRFSQNIAKKRNALTKTDVSPASAF